MKGSIIVVSFFLLGCILGWIGCLPAFLLEGNITIYVLYLLMFQVGLSIGSDKKLKEILKSIRLRLLLVPFATIVGTLSFSALISFFISQLKEPSLGIQLATELGTIALISNIMREIMALLGAPLFVRFFGKLAPICAGGATTMDTTLPIITRYSGKELVFISIFHGIIVDFTVPSFVSFFCSFS